KIECIRYARENRVPYLGLCLGFQMAVIEFARNVCGIADADSSESPPGCKNCVIDILPEQKKIEGLGGNMRLGGKDVLVTPGTLAAFLYAEQGGAPGGQQKEPCTIRERSRHRYEVDPNYIARLEQGGLVFSGRHPEQ